MLRTTVLAITCLGTQTDSRGTTLRSSKSKKFAYTRRTTKFLRENVLKNCRPGSEDKMRLVFKKPLLSSLEEQCGSCLGDAGSYSCGSGWISVKHKGVWGLQRRSSDKQSESCPHATYARRQGSNTIYITMEPGRYEKALPATPRPLATVLDSGYCRKLKGIGGKVCTVPLRIAVLNI